MNAKTFQDVPKDWVKTSKCKKCGFHAASSASSPLMDLSVLCDVSHEIDMTPFSCPNFRDSQTEA